MEKREYPQPGDRVAAYPLSTHRDEHHVYVYGFGLYDADAVPPIDFGLDDNGAPKTNPRIMLDDNRGIIWGYECFFTFENIVKSEALGKEIVLIDINTVRAQWVRENLTDSSPN